MKISREEASKELEKRGYKRHEKDLGIWVAPNGDKLAWFIALQREKIKFDSKTWGLAIREVKKQWEEIKAKRKKKKG